MTPLLLDQRSIFKAGIAVSLGMLAVFSTGYYLGLQKAGFSGIIGLNRTIALALPKPAHADTDEPEPQFPVAQLPGAIIDADSSGTDTNAKQKAAALTDDNAIQLTNGPVTSATADEESTPQKGARLQLASLTIPAQVLNAGSEAASELHDKKPAELVDEESSKALADAARQSLITDTATAVDARYTIQVGVFADAENALRRMSELESYQLSAYAEGYANKRNQLRFNVRFGYFRDKASAVAALNRFEQDLSGTGYVTRIRRD
jgi:cell division septation protein DedD